MLFAPGSSIPASFIGSCSLVTLLRGKSAHAEPRSGASGPWPARLRRLCPPYIKGKALRLPDSEFLLSTLMEA